MEHDLPLQLDDEPADAIAAALFVRRLRCFRLREFLEARIIPERIEHWIEPEQRGSKRIKYYATYNRRLPAAAGRLRITQIKN